MLRLETVTLELERAEDNHVSISIVIPSPSRIHSASHRYPNGYWRTRQMLQLLMCEENCVREFNGTRARARTSPALPPPGSICACGWATLPLLLDTIITFHSDRMRIYGFYVFLLWLSESLSVVLLRILHFDADFHVSRGNSNESRVVSSHIIES
jgi:hypothetical protein